MTNVQDDNRTMMAYTKKVLAAAPSGLIAGVPGAAVLVGQFLDSYDVLVVNSEVQTTDISGFAIVKAERRVTMVQNLVSLCRSVRSYGVSIEDSVLLRELGWSESMLMYLPGAICADTCKRMVDLVEPLLPELVDYEVTLATIADARASISAFKVFLTGPRENIIDRSLATRNIGLMVRKCMGILRKLDIKLAPLVNRKPAFYAKYILGREVVRTGFRKISLTCKVVDVNGFAVEKVTVWFEGLKLVKKTTALGNFQVKHLPGRVYKLTYRKFGIEDHVEEVVINDGLRTKIVVVMNYSS